MMAASGSSASTVESDEDVKGRCCLVLVRIGRQMVLTPLAESLADPVHDVVLQVQAIIDHTPAFDPARSERNITIMVSDYVATTFLPQLLQRVHAEAPRIVVDLVSQEDHVHGPLSRGE